MSKSVLPVLAEIAGGSAAGSRAWSLSRADLKAFDALHGGLGGREMVLVTGAEQGRPATGVGLATAAAAAGVRTVIVECDLEQPGLAEALGLASTPGLHEYLGWEAEAGEILQPIALAGPASGRATTPLICIVAGARSDDGAVLLASQSFQHAAQKLRHAYELVVLVGPPLERDAAVLAELAGVVDATLACVSREEVSGRPAKTIRNALRRLSAPAPGFVLFGA